MPFLAAIPAALGTAGTIGAGVATAGAIGKGAAGKAAGGHQQNIAEARLRDAMSNRSQMLASADPTSGELAELDRQNELLNKFLNTQQAGLNQQASVLGRLDPVFAESLRQSQAVLEGKESGLLAPMAAKRAQQREALVNSLRGQMGAGFETSTAGAQALARFDAESQGQIAQAQQSTLGSLNATSQAIGGLRSQAAQTAGALSAQRLAGMGALQNRRIGALKASDTSQYQGASEIGGLASAQSLGTMFGDIGSAGGQILGGSLGKGAGTLGQLGGNGGVPQGGFGMNPVGEAEWMKYAQK